MSEALINYDRGVVRPLDRDIITGKVQAQRRASRGAARSADGRLALANCLDNSLLLYDVASGKLIRNFREVPAPNHNASFLADGRHVLTGYHRQDYAGLWDVETGREVYRIAGNPQGVTKIVFSLDGRRALSAGGDGSVRLWGLPD